MKLELINKISKPEEVRFDSLREGEMFIEDGNTVCMVVEEAYTDDDDDFVNCVVLSGAAIGKTIHYDYAELVTPIRAQLVVLGYE